MHSSVYAPSLVPLLGRQFPYVIRAVKRCGESEAILGGLLRLEMVRGCYHDQVFEVELGRRRDLEKVMGLHGTVLLGLLAADLQQDRKWIVDCLAAYHEGRKA